MERRHRGVFPPLAAAAVVAVAVALAAPANTAAQDGRLEALRLDDAASGAFRLDGILSEPFWQRAVAVDDLRQREPIEGAPASERTEVRVAYDGGTLYVGIVAYDSEPERVVARILQRDRVMRPSFGSGLEATGDDVVALVMDPFHDQRNGVILATNPNGAEFDALITDEGSEINVDWRGVWEVAAERTPDGWSAEFAIPFRSLRYPDASGEEVWGLNVYRMIRRKNESVLWRSWNRDGGGFHRISQAGDLVGLRDLPRTGLNAEVKPFVLAGRTKTPDDAGQLRGRGEFEVGLDVKAELRPGLVLDLTANTDFAQVEVDDQQVNLTRFNLFFPEKRDFFLENAGIFEFGVPGFFETPPFLMFFSRRIGIDEDGEVPILGGGRLTGRVGGQTVGLLSVRTGDAHGRSGETFNVLRVKRDVGESAYVGAMLSDRRGEGPWNTVAGLDGQIFVHPTVLVSGFLARSVTEGPGGDDPAYQVAVDFTGDRWGGFVQHFAVYPEATASSGFITRTDLRRTQLAGRRTFRPGRLGVRRMDLRIANQYQTTTEARFQDWSTGPSLNVEWDSGDGLRLDLNMGESQVDDTFPLAGLVEVPAGRYRADRASMGFNSSPSRAWSVGLDARASDAFGGDVVGWSGSVTLTPDPSISATASFSRSDVDLPGGSFTADVTTLRASYAFSTRMTLHALVQHNGLTDELSTNVRFNFIHRPGSDLYLVFTEERGVDDDLWELADRGMVAKVTYLMRF
ncbi:MAG TPA: DUF5916 domain-containing protein [Longimicrobiales bacterium]|jgi:hypothetical protein